MRHIITILLIISTLSLIWMSTFVGGSFYFGSFFQRYLPLILISLSIITLVLTPYGAHAWIKLIAVVAIILNILAIVGIYYY